jgi:hypothetical protein
LYVYDTLSEQYRTSPVNKLDGLYKENNTFLYKAPLYYLYSTEHNEDKVNIYCRGDYIDVKVQVPKNSKNNHIYKYFHAFTALQSPTSPPSVPILSHLKCWDNNLWKKVTNDTGSK